MTEQPERSVRAGREVWRALAVRGSAIEVVAYGISLVLRFGGNLVLTRLLTTGDFGLTQTVFAVLTGLEMLSDIGIQQAIIQRPQGDRHSFLNTAWTIQLMRGAILWPVAVLVAGPVAALNREPQLHELLLVASIQLPLLALLSTSMFTLRRHLRLGWVNAIEILSQFLALAVTVVWALIEPSVWALVAGALTRSLVRVACSHLLPVGYRNRPQLDRTAARSIFGFGKWIFGSSLVHFFSGQGDRLIIGPLMGKHFLGVYSVAALISESIVALITKVVHGVFYPLLSRAAEHGTDAVRHEFYRSRIALDALAYPGAGFLLVVGDRVVAMLWPASFHEAGWILQLLSLRIATDCLMTSGETVLTALAKPWYGFYRSVSKTGWIVLGLPVANYLGGADGLVWVLATVEAPCFFVIWTGLIRSRVFRPLREAAVVVAFAAGVSLGLLARAIV